MTAPPIDVAAGAVSGTTTVSVDVVRRHGRTPLQLHATSPGSLAQGNATATILVRGPAGSIDTGFGSAGVFTLGQASEATGLVFANSGHALVGGRIGTDAAVVRLNEDGSIDTTYGVGGKARAPAGVLGSTNDLIATGGNIFLGATADSGVGDRATIVSFTASGAVNATFGTQGVNTFPYSRGSSLAYSPKTGGIVMGVRRTVADADLLVALANTTGGVATFWGTNGTAESTNDCPGDKTQCYTRALTLAPNGTVFFCAPRNDGAWVASTDVGGTTFPFPKFATSLFVDTCTSLGLDVTNRLYVAGGSSGVASVGRFSTNGSLDGPGWANAGDRPGVALAPTGSNMVLARRVLVASDGRVLVAADSMAG